MGEPLVDQAAVDFQLGFAGAAQEAEAAALPLQVGPGPHQAAALIRQMGQLDLQAAFARARAGALLASPRRGDPALHDAEGLRRPGNPRTSMTRRSGNNGDEKQG